MKLKAVSASVLIAAALVFYPISYASAGVGSKGGVGSGSHGVGRGGGGVGSGGHGVGGSGSIGVGLGGHGVGRGGHGVGRGTIGVGQSGHGVGRGSHGFQGDYGVGHNGHGVGHGEHGVGRGSLKLPERVAIRNGRGIGGDAGGYGFGYVVNPTSGERKPIKGGTAFATDGANAGTGLEYPRLGNYPFGGNSGVFGPSAQ